jgi:hypothetical protein
VTSCQYFSILLLKSFSVRNVIWTWVQFSMVMKLWTELKDDFNDTKHDYRCTSSMTGHPTFQLTPKDRPLTSLPPDFHVWNYQNMVCDYKVNQRELLHQICSAAWCKNDPDGLEFKISVALQPFRIRPMFIWHFWPGMASGIRSWSTDVKSLDILYVYYHM